MDVLAWMHPSAFVALALVFLGRGEWPSKQLTLGWMTVPVLLNSPLWAIGSRLFGWQFGGLGGYLYFWFVLPANALFLGLCAPPFLHLRLGGGRSKALEFLFGALLEATILFMNLAVLSRVDIVVGNVAS